jgi:hypothetical protein
VSAEAEKRQAARYETLNQARVIAGKAAIYCAVRDLSITGAKLQVGSCSYVPPVFKISLGKLDALFDAKVAWRTEDYIGIVFDRPLDACELEVIKKTMPLQPQRRFSNRAPMHYDSDALE